MSTGDINNFGPWYERDKVPCEGEVGDILVMTPLKQGEPDRSPPLQGKASVWFCIKSQSDEGDAVWALVSFDGVANCGTPIPDPPLDRPILRRG